MRADDVSAGDQWPLPPAWMWDCAECVRLYEDMKHVQAVIAEAQLTAEPGVDWDPMDSIVGTQIQLGHHLAMAHLDELPDWDPECERCAEHQDALAREITSPRLGAGVAGVAAEHRARHLFAPPRILGLM